MNWRRDMTENKRKHDWLVRAVLAGFAATATMTGAFALAFGIASVLGSDSPQAPTMTGWVWHLTHNMVTAEAETAVPIAVILHFVAGMLWAVVYAAFGEPRLPGPGWRRGLLFAAAPGVLSLVVFLPALGGGLLGLGLGAGPLPLIGNLLLHVVYGTTLGYVYSPQSERLLTERGEADSAADLWTMSHSERAMATGIVVGLFVGGIVAWVGAVAFAPGQPSLVALMIGAILGSAAGALIGSISGLEPHHP